MKKEPAVKEETFGLGKLMQKVKNVIEKRVQNIFYAWSFH